MNNPEDGFLKKGFRRDIAVQKRVDYEGEIREMKEDSAVGDFTDFVRDQNVAAEELSHDDISYFIRYGDLSGLGMGEDIRIPKELRLSELRTDWEKEKKEKQAKTPEI